MSDKRIEAIYPLSPLQEGLLFHTLQNPGAYHNQFICALEGDLDVPRFQQAWQQVIDQHPVLRTAILWKRRGRPLQIVHKQLTVPWHCEDWRALAPEQQAAALEAILAADFAQPFEIARAPLMRFALIQLTETHFQCIWSYHHILLDGWSLAQLLRDVMSCYTAINQSQALPFRAHRPYQDYIEWLQHQDLTRAEHFWRQTLAAFHATPVFTQWGSAPSEPEETTYLEHHCWLSEEASTLLQTFARQQRLTLNTLFQGAWAFLLSYYSGTQESLFGVTTSGRSIVLAGIENMIGLFINTLPLRVPIALDLSVLAWLQLVQERHLEMLQYEYTPLAKILAWSGLPPETALFESLLVFENYPVDPALYESHLSVCIRDARSVEQTNYPLTLAVRAGKQIMLSLSFQSSRFTPASIRRLAEQLQQVLLTMARRPQQRLADLSPLTEADRHQLLVDWNATRTTDAWDVSLHGLIERRVQQAPDAVAIVSEQETLTYGELNARANQLAHYLQQRGIDAEIRVGLCLHRSPALLIAMLGVLKAGGVYVPLDPTYPVERLAFFLKDSAVALLVSNAPLPVELSGHRVENVCLEQANAHIRQCSRANLASHTTAQNAAYCIYTSGSTGRPKGILVPHKAIVNHAVAMATRYALQEGDRVLQFASASFDVALEEIFPTWSSGATLVLPPPFLLAPVDLCAFVEQAGLTVLNLPTAYWHDWMNELAIASPTSPPPTSLRLVIVGGEAVHTDRLATWERWRKQARTTLRWLNAYGPTETTVTSTVYEPLLAGPTEQTALVPIGRPIANVRHYVLNALLQPVPIGVAGELYIGGAGLARGYAGLPALTAFHFISDPFSQEPGARLYRTGDLVRWREDGVLEFLGRRDRQAKIRGFRIEPGEIEACVCQHPLVREAVVQVREDRPGEKRLIAYLVPATEGMAISGEVDNYLKQALPSYMRPAAYVILDRLPVTPQGKLDYHALPSPALTPAYSQAIQAIAPQTAMEQLIAEIWREVLQVHTVDIHHNFFDLGGHSLLLTRVYGALRTAIEREIAMTDLFNYPTIFSLARYLSQEPGEDQRSFQEQQVYAGKRQALLQQQRQRRQRATRSTATEKGAAHD